MLKPWNIEHVQIDGADIFFSGSLSFLAITVIVVSEKNWIDIIKVGDTIVQVLVYKKVICNLYKCISLYCNVIF